MERVRRPQGYVRSAEHAIPRRHGFRSDGSLRPARDIVSGSEAPAESSRCVDSRTAAVPMAMGRPALDGTGRSATRAFLIDEATSGSNGLVPPGVHRCDGWLRQAFPLLRARSAHAGLLPDDRVHRGTLERVPRPRIPTALAPSGTASPPRAGSRRKATCSSSPESTGAISP